MVFALYFLKKLVYGFRLVSQEHVRDWGTGLVTTESLLPAACAWDEVASRAVCTAWRPRGFSTAASIFPFWLQVSHKDHSQRLPMVGVAACAQPWLWRENRLSPNLRSWHLVALIRVSKGCSQACVAWWPRVPSPAPGEPKDWCVASAATEQTEEPGLLSPLVLPKKGQSLDLPCHASLSAGRGRTPLSAMCPLS